MVHSIHTEGPHASPQGTQRHLHIVALDHPNTDSRIKQLAAYVGEASNHPHIYVTKEGVDGIQPWTIANRAYHGGTAHPTAILFANQAV